MADAAAIILAREIAEIAIESRQAARKRGAIVTAPIGSKVKVPVTLTV
jgi:hypothetical protein